KLCFVRSMKGLLAILLVLSGATLARAQTKSDEDAVRALPRAFCEAWAKHGGHQLATIMAEDVDFVTVGGAWFHGRSDFEKYHTRLLSGRFRDSTNTPLETIVRFLRPDEAVVHWSWTIEGGQESGRLSTGEAVWDHDHAGKKAGRGVSGD